MRVDGVLFDIDDTLVDTRGAFGHALSDVARRYLPDLPPERHPELVTVWRADVGGHYAAYTRGEVGFVEQRMTRANELHELFGGPTLDADGFAVWDESFQQAFADAWVAHPDVDAVLDKLLAAGLAVGALSNASVGLQTTKLERVRLLDRVPMLVGVDTLGFGKPDPRVFVEACRRLGTAPERTAYVGDELDVDAVAARAAGLLGIWVDRPGGRRLPLTDAEIAAADVVTIESFDQLPGVLGL
ncbi:HAD family hydrolase [Cellulomonas humilata]|uniref:Hydrolase of the HAD superfamily n=1 Tax=Cellulomonas humilata TaxID=144055 RepID=A0ABU0EKK2_9CELL|nr:HAD family hydrolase [Cellulomonas humilata]MDQ0375815.1 putative hydrolase of the HAD superfamily [Cellulomonas humilata]